MDKSQTQNRLFYYTVLFATIILSSYYVYAAFLIYKYGSNARNPGWRFSSKSGEWYVTEIDSSGPASGKLRIGDKIIAINDDARIRRIGPFWKIRTVRTGGTYSVQVVRNSVEQRYQLNLVLKKDSQRLVEILVLFAVSLVFTAIGVVMGLLKPEQRITRIGTAALIGVGLNRLGLALSLTAGFLQGTEKILYVLVWLFHPVQLAVAYDFFCDFPPGILKSRNTGHR